MTRDDKAPATATKVELTKEELSDEQLASIAGGQRLPHHGRPSPKPRPSMAERADPPERPELE